MEARRADHGPRVEARLEGHVDLAVSRAVRESGARQRVSGSPQAQGATGDLVDVHVHAELAECRLEHRTRDVSVLHDEPHPSTLEGLGALLHQRSHSLRRNDGDAVDAHSG